ncbi:MAG: DUF1631 family protein [Ketobacteraceae bacterium]|nr:DUF1631 family protein [Ketobacteraceae bacterium]
MSHLMGKLKQLAMQMIRERMDHLFAVADNWLMDQMDASRDPGLQQQYAEMMRFLKRYRSQFEAAFFPFIENSFTRLESPDLQNSQAQKPVLRDVSYDALTLVGHEEMEQNVALESMVARARSEMSGNLQMLRARLQSLVSGRRLSADQNPLDPKVLCEALGRSSGNIPWDVKHDLIFFKLFQRYVLNGYVEVVNAADALLADAGVLKNRSQRELLQYLHQNPRQRTIASRAVKTGSSGDQRGATPAPAQSAKAANQPGQPRWDQVLQGTLASLRQPGAFAGQKALGSQNARAATLPLAELVDMFQQLQAAPPRDSRKGHWKTAALCAQLDLMVRRKGSQGKTFRTAEVDTNIINLVSRIFEQVLEQEKLPARVNVLLGRLQIPCIRIAISDPEFLANDIHPARRLINDLADAGMALNEHAEGASDTVFEKIRYVVETVVNEYQGDIILVQMLCDEFAAFMTRERHRARILAQRMATLEEGKARAERVKQEVSQAVQAIVGDQQLPEPMARILDTVWYNYLCWLHHRGGKGSFDWTRALFQVERMLIYLLPVDSETEAEDRREAIDDLEHHLRLGAEKINCLNSTVSHTLSELSAILKEKACYTATAEQHSRASMEFLEVLPETANERGDEGCDATDNAPEVRRPAVCADTLQEPPEKVTLLDVTRKTPPTPEPEPATCPESLPENDEGWCQAGNLSVGALMEYLHQGKPVRCKLAAHIRSVDKMIFVNYAGAKLFEKSRLQVAHDINQGRLNLLDDSRLFDRALESVISSLRQVRGQAV